MSSAVVANPGPSWHAIGTGGGGSDILLPEHERPNRDLGHERDQHRQQRRRERQRRAKLARGRADLKRDFVLASFPYVC